jgi:hypothetical protein
MKWLSTLLPGLLTAAILLFSPAAHAGPQPARRLALVVGNVDYVNHPRLANVASDVIAVRDQLKAMQFDVVVTPPQRSTAEEFTTLDLVPFAAQIRPGDIVVFYYSGHGFSYGPDNFMVPIGVPAQVDEADVQFVFPAESSIRSFLQARRPAFLLMLMDACRSRPGFVRNGVQTGAEKGYAMPQKPPEDVSITSAVAPNYVASAGPAGEKSIFTEALVANMAVPGRELSVLQGKISYQMRQASLQEPWVAENRVARLWLLTSPAVDEEARMAWDEARATGSRDKVMEYLAWYAAGPYAADARKWLADNPIATIARPVEVSPINVDLAWKEAFKTNTVASAAAFNGLKVSRIQSIGSYATDPAKLRNDLALDPLALNATALTTKSLANGSIKKGTLIDLFFRRAQMSSPLDPVLSPLRKDVTLGKATIENFLTADPSGSGATVPSAQVATIMATARSGGQQISRVSLATARGPRADTVARSLMATSAAALFIKAGIPADQITTVEGVPEVFDGERVRIFTK